MRVEGHKPEPVHLIEFVFDFFTYSPDIPGPPKVTNFVSCCKSFMW